MPLHHPAATPAGHRSEGAIRGAPRCGNDASCPRKLTATASRCGTPVAHRQQPSTRGSARLMSGTTLPARSGFSHRDANSRPPVCTDGGSREATSNSWHDRGRGGSGGPFRLRDGGRPCLHERQLRERHVCSGHFATGLRPSRIGSTAIDGWTVTKGNVDWTESGIWQAADGTKSIDLDGAENTAGAISRPSTPIVDGTYVVTFSMSGNPGNPSRSPIKTMSVDAAGATQRRTPTTPPRMAPPSTT